MRLFPLIALIFLAMLFYWWFTRTPAPQVARTLKRALLWIGGGLLILLAATGRLPSLFALIGALAPFMHRLLGLLQVLPLLQRVAALLRRTRNSEGATTQQTSRVRTDYLDMRLDHDSGAMSGTVLGGRFAGNALAALTLAQLLELLNECRHHDAQSAAVLEAYLDREHGAAWRQHDDAATDDTATPTTTLSVQQAYEILGLDASADAEQIIAAHRRLMQKLHPDRGGSTYLAAQINRAKDILLQEKA